MEIGQDLGQPPASAPRAMAGMLLRVAVVSQAQDDRAALSTAFASHPGHRVSCSCPLDGAAAVLDGAPVDAIIGFVDDQRGWHQFRMLSGRYPDVLSVLIVSDPERLDAETDGRILNAVVTLSRDELAHRAAEITDRAADEWEAGRSPAATAEAHDQRRLETLTDREREVLALTAGGLSIKEIAQRISRSYATVASHRSRIMEKLGLHDKVALTRFAIRAGLVGP